MSPQIGGVYVKSPERDLLLILERCREVMQGCTNILRFKHNKCYLCCIFSSTELEKVLLGSSCLLSSAWTKTERGLDVLFLGGMSVKLTVTNGLLSPRRPKHALLLLTTECFQKTALCHVAVNLILTSIKSVHFSMTAAQK